MLDDHTDALFPSPRSPAGKLLAHLVSRQIPGTPIDTTAAALGRGAGLRPDDAAAALSKLTDDGLVLVEPGTTGDTATITVLLAPPLDDYGIHPQWAERDAPVMAPPSPPAAPAHLAPSVTSAAAPKPTAPTANLSGSTAQAGSSASSARPNAPAGTAPTRQREQAGANHGRAHAAAPAAADAAAAPSPAETPASGVGTAGPGTGEPPSGHPRSAPPVRTLRRAAPRGAATQPLPLPEASEPPAAASETRQDAAPPRAAARRGGEPARVDETALVRGFVDRFERLLAELDEWKRRAQSAEEGRAAAEKLLRSAERRAETAEARLAEAQERLRTWAELTKRMQQLSRQADGGSRGRAMAVPSSAQGPGATTGQADSGSKGRVIAPR